MAFKVPQAKLVKATIITVMNDVGCIDSIALLRELVLKELQKVEPLYALSHERLRRIVAGMREMTVYIRASESQEYTTLLGGEKALVNLKKCPVCGNNLKPIRNQTLYGWVVVIEKKCPLCGYWTGSKIRKPYKYEICLKGRRNN